MHDGPGEAQLPCPTGPRVGVWGTLDHAAGALRARVVRLELLRRLPDADVRLFTPSGRPTLFDGGLPTEPRRAESAGSLDAVVLLIDEGDGSSPFPVGGLGSGLAGACPVVTLDEPVAVLAARWFPAALLTRRLAILDHLGYPERGLPHVAGVEDVLAAALADSSPPTDETLASWVAALRGNVEVAEIARVDARLDELADRITAAADARWASERGGDAPPRWWQSVRTLHERLRTLRSAYDERGERLMTERAAMADAVDRLEAEIEQLRSGAMVAQLERELGVALARLARYEEERLRLQADVARLAQESRAARHP